MREFDEHSEQKRRNAEEKRNKTLRSMKNRHFANAASHYDTVDMAAYNNTVKNFNYRYLGNGVFMSPAEAKAERLLSKEFIFSEAKAEADIDQRPVQEVPKEVEIQTMDQKKQAAVYQM